MTHLSPVTSMNYSCNFLICVILIKFSGEDCLSGTCVESQCGCIDDVACGNNGQTCNVTSGGTKST